MFPSINLKKAPYVQRTTFKPTVTFELSVYYPRPKANKTDHVAQMDRKSMHDLALYFWVYSMILATLHVEFVGALLRAMCNYSFRLQRHIKPTLSPLYEISNSNSTTNAPPNESTTLKHGRL